MIKVRSRKLIESKWKAVGLCDYESDTVFVDLRQTDRELLDTLVHELLHYVAPEFCETRVLRNATTIANQLYRHGCRVDRGKLKPHKR